MWSDGTTVWFKEDIADGKLYSYNLPSVAGTTTLSALSITYGSSDTEAALRPAFALSEHSYEAAVPSSAGRVTVAASANDSSSNVQLLSSRGLLSDADTVAAGHQLDIPVGSVRLFLKVTSSSGDALTYTVLFGRDSSLVHGWTPTKDINDLFAGEDFKPQGIWSDGTTVWVGGRNWAPIHAYTLATGARDPDKDITPLNDIEDSQVQQVTSLWGNATTLWAGGPGNKIWAYKLDLNADGTAGDNFGARDSDMDITLDADNSSAKGIWSDGATMWVADLHDNKVYAYALPDGARQTNKDFDLGLVRANIGGIWSDGDTIWATDSSTGGRTLRAYKLDLNNDGSPGDDFGDRDPGKDIPLGVSSNGVWSDGATIWVTTTNPKKAYSFNMASREGALTLTGLAVTYDSGTDAAVRPAFASDQYDYRTAVPNSAGQVTVTPTQHTATSTVSYVAPNGVAIPDADGGAGQQVSARVGVTPVQVQVTSGAVSQTYVLTVERDSAEVWGWTPTQDYNYLTAGNNSIRGMWSNADTLYVSHLLDKKIYAYDLENGSRDSGKDITLPTAEGSAEVLNQHSRGLWSDGTTLWAVDQVDEILYAYTLSTGDHDADKDIDLSFPSRESAIDVWSDGTTIWVSDTSDAILYAYKLDINDDGTSGADFGARDEDKDIALTSANNDPTGIWSDGETMWVADWFGRRAYAYALEDGVRKADQEFELGAGPRALWSDGVSMLAMTSTGKKIYSYRMPAAVLPMLSVWSLETNEGIGMAPITLVLSAAAAADVTVTCTASLESGDTAEADDLALGTTTGTVSAGQTTGSCPVALVNDTTDEEGETFTVTLSDVSSNAQLDITSASVTIGDNDDPPTLSVNDVSGTEGTSLTFTVTLSAESEKTVTVDYATSEADPQSAVSGTDFTAASGKLTFSPGDPGDTTKTITVTTTEDTTVESSETFTLTLSNPTNATLGTKVAATGTINDAAATAPTISTVAVTSTPVLETDTYGAGETIEVSVTFSEAVNATSDTDFVLSVGGATRAPLLRGSGTATLVFGYTVALGDEDDNGIWIGGPGPDPGGRPQRESPERHDHERGHEHGGEPHPCRARHAVGPQGGRLAVDRLGGGDFDAGAGDRHLRGGRDDPLHGDLHRRGGRDRGPGLAVRARQLGQRAGGRRGVRVGQRQQGAGVRLHGGVDRRGRQRHLPAGRRGLRQPGRPGAARFER